MRDPFKQKIKRSQKKLNYIKYGFYREVIE